MSKYYHLELSAFSKTSLNGEAFLSLLDKENFENIWDYIEIKKQDHEFRISITQLGYLPSLIEKFSIKYPQYIFFQRISGEAILHPFSSFGKQGKVYKIQEKKHLDFLHQITDDKIYFSDKDYDKFDSLFQELNELNLLDTSNDKQAR